MMLLILKSLKNKFLVSLFSDILKFSISVNGKSESVENLLKKNKVTNKNIGLIVNELFQFCNTKPLNLKFIE